MNYRMILQYDGGRYQGWQRQKEKNKDTQNIKKKTTNKSNKKKITNTQNQN